MEQTEMRWAPLKICFWCICPRTGQLRYGLLTEEGVPWSILVDAKLRGGSNLDIDIKAILDTENAQVDFVLGCDFMKPMDSSGRLIRTHYAYCQIDLSKYAFEREHRQLPAMSFQTLEALQYNAGISEHNNNVRVTLLGETKLLEAYPPKIPQQ